MKEAVLNDKGVVLYGQLGVAASKSYPVHGHANVGADDGDAARKVCNGAEEVAKQNDYTVSFYQEADECPLHEDQ